MGIPTTIEDLRDASPGAQMLERLRKGTDQGKIVQWPGTDSSDKSSQFWMAPLGCDQLQDAYAEAHARFEKIGLPLNVYTSPDWHSEVAMCILARSMRQLEDRNETLFANAEELRPLLSPEVRDHLAEDFVALAKECDPDPAEMDRDVLAKIDEFVKKKDARALASFDSSILSAYIVGTESPSAN